MKYLIILISVISFEAFAGCNTRTIGSTAFTNCDDGTSYNARKIGNTTFYSGDINATSRNIGGTTFYDGDVSGTSRNIGGTTFYDTNQGSYSGRDIGGSTFYTNGVTCRNIGSTRFCD